MNHIFRIHQKLKKVMTMNHLHQFQREEKTHSVYIQRQLTVSFIFLGDIPWDSWPQSNVPSGIDFCWNEKLESWKGWSWKVSVWVGKSPAKFERTKRSWKVCSEVGRIRWSWKKFLTSSVTFQLQLDIFNFSPNFPTSFFSISCWTF